jgi:hypothetical protein
MFGKYINRKGVIRVKKIENKIDQSFGKVCYKATKKAEKMPNNKLKCRLGGFIRLTDITV